MMHYRLLCYTAALGLFLGGCAGGSNDDNATPNLPPLGGGSSNFDVTSESATYSVQFTGQWSPVNFTFVPSGAGFTNLSVAVVNPEANLWLQGASASAGLELLAEQGITTQYANEVSAAIINNQAASGPNRNQIVLGVGPEASRTFTVVVDRTFSHINVASSLTPSNDWFVGLSEQNLLNGSGEWPNQVSFSLLVYDAGTESGDMFSRDGTTTTPRGVIAPLNTNVFTASGAVPFTGGLVNGNAIASMTFTRTN